MPPGSVAYLAPREASSSKALLVFSATSSGKSSSPNQRSSLCLSLSAFAAMPEAIFARWTKGN